MEIGFRVLVSIWVFIWSKRVHLQGGMEKNMRVIVFVRARGHKGHADLVSILIAPTCHTIDPQGPNPKPYTL